MATTILGSDVADTEMADQGNQLNWKGHLKLPSFVTNGTSKRPKIGLVPLFQTRGESAIS